MVCTATVGLLLGPQELLLAPGRLSWDMYVLRGNKNLRRCLQDLGHLSNDQLRHHLSGLNFVGRSNIRDFIPRISVVDKAQQPVRVVPTSKLNQSMNWLRPLALRKSFIISAGVLLATIIAALEVVQRQSGRDGFMEVSISATLGHTLSTYIPAAVLLPTAEVLASADFAVKIFAPYQCSRLRGTFAQRSVLYSAFGLPPTVLLQSLRRRHYAVFLATTSSLLGSVLTIISAGLYTIDSVPAAYQTTRPTLRSFNVNWNGTVNDVKDGLIVNLLEHHATYPNGTFDEFGYPFISLETDGTESERLLRGPASMKARINVTRPSINCSLVPTSQIFVSIENTDWMVNITAVMDVPEQCQSGGVLQGFTKMQLGTVSADGGFATLSGSASYSGSLVFTSPVRSDGITGSDLTYYPDTCPSLGFIWGAYVNGTNDPSNTSAYVCRQYIEEIPAMLSFHLPDMVLDKSNPPVLDETQGTVISQKQFDKGYLALHGLDGPQGCGALDGLMSPAVCGSQSNTTLSDLGNPARREEVFAAAHHV